MAQTDSENASLHQWRARMRKRRGSGLDSGAHELNLVAMMDMMTIILVFLLKSYSGATLAVDMAEKFQFPKSTHQTTPADALKLTVTSPANGGGKIILDTTTIAELDAKTVASMKRSARNRNYMIPDLFKALKVKAAMQQEEAKVVDEKGKFEGNILIIADKEVPYWLLTSALFTSAEAGFDKYSLVAVKKHQ